MAVSVHFNGAALRTHRNLITADRALSVSLERLSSGTRLRTAGDDPSAMVLANQVRYHISGLTRAAANGEEGVSMLQTADGAMDEISSLLLRARSLAVQAANEGANDLNTLNALQDELNTTIESISRIAGSTRFGSLSLLDGSLGGNQLSTAATPLIDELDHVAASLPGGVLAGSRLSVIMPPLGLTLDRDRVQQTLTVAALPADDDVALSATDQFAALTFPRTMSFTSAAGTYSLNVTATTTSLASQTSVNTQTVSDATIGFKDAAATTRVHATQVHMVASEISQQLTNLLQNTTAQIGRLTQSGHPQRDEALKN